jgi:hypothetical protein
MCLRGYTSLILSFIAPHFCPKPRVANGLSLSGKPPERTRYKGFAMPLVSSYARDYGLSHVIETYDLNRTINAESAVLEKQSPPSVCAGFICFRKDSIVLSERSRPSITVLRDDLSIFEPLKDFPSDSEARDARTMNEFLEGQISRFPEQYYWVHRRFKGRPDGMRGVY